MASKNQKFLGKYNESKVLNEINILLDENQMLKETIQSREQEFVALHHDYRKIQFFMYELEKMDLGISIYQLFQTKIHDCDPEELTRKMDCSPFKHKG